MRSVQFWFLCFVALVVTTVIVGVSVQSVPESSPLLFQTKSNSVSLLRLTPTETATNTAEFFLVKRVVDGDTIQLQNGDKVRYIGVNTPETVDPRRPVQCFGKEAKEKNREFVEGKLVRLVKDISETDRYGRKLRYVYAGEVFINSELIKFGYATTETVPPDVHFSNFFRDLEATAREQKIGLWQSCRK